PAGGDGGRGGDVIFELRRNLRTLADIRYHQTFKAQNGFPGMGKNRYGKDGEDIVIPVPPGTVIMDAETGEVLKDFGSDRSSSVDGTRWVFLTGGKGGMGNTHFKTSTNQAPKIAQPGKPGKQTKLKIELQLIADIGFVGFPNAGKSSLLDHFTNARPKIAPYPFTTKIPNLGMLNIHERDIVLADIPGIIEGAHDGAGLGIRFLKHISRTSCLAFLIDLSEENRGSAFSVLLNELEAFSPRLASKRRVLIASKLDLPEAEEHFEAFKTAHPDEEIFGISVFSDRGMNELKEAFFQIVCNEEKKVAEAKEEDDKLFESFGTDELFGTSDTETSTRAEKPFPDWQKDEPSKTVPTGNSRTE
ncbi:MAG: GTPase ObgE, partial [Rectinemataceae bacterium]|nr:GTPase ObgE [Rectinemataceae bacterium]